MTLSTTLAVKQYDGDGVTTNFPTVFKFIANDDVRVTLKDADGTETVWTEDTHYVLAGAGSDAGGTVTVSASPTDYTPAAGETLVIERITAPTQETDYPEGGAFPAVAHENALDKLTMLVQELRGQLDRSLRYPVSDPVGLSAEIPNAATRASRYLAFDADGATIAADAPEGGNVVSAFIGTLLDDADASAARGTLGLGTAATKDTGMGSGDLPTNADISEKLAQTGDLKVTIRTTAPSGWLMLNGDSIGSAASGANQASSDFEALFKVFWNSMNDAQAPVSGGRGASAQEDWEADKILTMPDARGRTIIGTGTGSGLSARTHGDTGGEEMHTLTMAEMPAHTHPSPSGWVFVVSNGNTAASGPSGSHPFAQSGDLRPILNATGSQGSTGPHNNMQPWLALNYIVKT